MNSTLISEKVSDIIFRKDVLRSNKKIEGKVAVSILFEIFLLIHNYLDTLSIEKEYFVMKLHSGDISFLKNLLFLIEKNYPLNVHSVFEDNEKITEIKADVWRENEILKNGGKAGIIKMLFAPECRKLPLHVHPLSSRILWLISGKGIGHYSLDDPENKETKIKSIEIDEGSIIFFKKNTIHTISTEQSSLTTITYHLPFFEFEDEKSFEKISNWYPEKKYL